MNIRKQAEIIIEAYNADMSIISRQLLATEDKQTMLIDKLPK